MVKHETEKIKEKIRKYVSDSAHSDKSNISDQSLIFEDGYFDSMGFITLITFIEDEFGVNVSDEDLVEEKFESIDAITDLIEGKLKNSILQK